ncbi:histidine kinase dimerization/phosphoacceptor domain -containing protein [Arenibacter sp. M-2]|uniref:sensor histidine kinase n=1 Tax=unclassified Arenibacter TaxID=2615047 RepID=UPI000D77343F|nr:MULTISPECIES: histidine kinase dimerization/phosphoacceptor domain -containing protein [unclassified Arenibacter]MDL5511897.1 histidine kinase dimerization/phosphoacceptor domain -containing protein [Arenibacter sp. M-2]PXX25597.1 two-component sensor histidine kinase [Arenibacter sp. ARW7G5Y1]
MICSLCFWYSPAQDSSNKPDYFQDFQNKKGAQERFDYFFGTPNRYLEDSAYDWQAAVNVYHNNAQKLKDSISITKYELMQSQLYYDIGDFSKSVAIANQLYKKIENLDLPSKKILLDLIDNNYAKLGLYDRQFEIRNEKKNLGLTDKVIFYDIYSNLGLHRKAMDDYIKDKLKTIREDDYYGQAQYQSNVGNYLLLDMSFPTALTYYKKAKGFIDVYLNDISREKTEQEISKGNLLKAIIEGNIGKCHALLKEYDIAIPFLENSIDLFNEYNKGKFSSEMVENTLELADCHLQNEDYEKAKEYLLNGQDPVKTENILRKNRLLAAYYDRIGDYKNSVDYLKRNVRIRDSLNRNESSMKKQQLAAVAGQEIEYSKKMMEQQKQDLEQFRSDLQAKEDRIHVVFISLIFTLLGFAGLVFAYLKSIKNQRLIADQKRIIEASLVEKDSLLKEIHHRVKNNLQMVSSLLSLQTKNTRSKAAIEALEEGKSRVKAMALIHQKLYQNDDLSVIEMQGYIESLINSVQSVYKKGGHNINITIDAEDVELDIDRAIPFGLILNELVSNSFKYAFPDDDENGKIYIHLRKNGGQGYFEYTDNGVGLPEDTDDRANSSMGIRLMNRLVNQLQSTLNIDKTSEGVRFWFNFK